MHTHIPTTYIVYLDLNQQLKASIIFSICYIHMYLIVNVARRRLQFHILLSCTIYIENDHNCFCWRIIIFDAWIHFLYTLYNTHTFIATIQQTYRIRCPSLTHTLLSNSKVQRNEKKNYKISFCRFSCVRLCVYVCGG